MNPIVKEFGKAYVKQNLPQLAVGDTIEIGVKIVEGEKERIYRFSGTLIAKGGSGVDRRITVRRIVQGEGVECVFQLNSPKIESIHVSRHGRVRRAKLYYLRDRVGKGVRLREERRDEVESAKVAAPAAPESAPAAAAPPAEAKSGS